MSHIYTKTLSYDPQTGIREIFQHDPTTGMCKNITVQDIEPILEANYERRKANPDGWKGTFHLVAHLPAVVVQELGKKGILNDEKALNRWLDLAENQVFRAKRGYLSK